MQGATLPSPAAGCKQTCLDTSGLSAFPQEKQKPLFNAVTSGAILLRQLLTDTDALACGFDELPLKSLPSLILAPHLHLPRGCCWLHMRNGSVATLL